MLADSGDAVLWFLLLFAGEVHPYDKLRKYFVISSVRFNSDHSRDTYKQVNCHWYEEIGKEWEIGWWDQWTMFIMYWYGIK